MNRERHTTFVSRGIFLLVLFLTPVLSLESWAVEAPSAMLGGSGGTRTYNLDCGPNGIMTGGMATRATKSIEQLVVICRTVNASTGALGEEYTRGPTGGMRGYHDTIQRCQDGLVVTRLEVSAGDFIVTLVLRCEIWLPDIRQPLQSPDRVNTLVLGEICGFCSKGTGPQGFRCPGFRVAKALRGRSGIHIDSLQMVCDDWDK